MKSSLPSSFLSPREVQIVRLIAQGKSNKIIAFELGLTKGTVGMYIHTIFQKLGLANRVEVAVWVVTNLDRIS